MSASERSEHSLTEKTHNETQSYHWQSYEKGYYEGWNAAISKVQMYFLHAKSKKPDRWFKLLEFFRLKR